MRPLVRWWRGRPFRSGLRSLTRRPLPQGLLSDHQHAIERLEGENRALRDRMDELSGFVLNLAHNMQGTTLPTPIPATPSPVLRHRERSADGGAEAARSQGTEGGDGASGGGDDGQEGSADPKADREDSVATDDAEAGAGEPPRSSRTPQSRRSSAKVPRMLVRARPLLALRGLTWGSSPRLRGCRTLA